MIDHGELLQRPLITRSRLVADLKRLGLQQGQVVMLHTSVRAIGWVVGGPDVVIQALLDVLGPEGTLMWLTKDHPLHYPYGPGSPFAKLCEANGRALLLGAPLNTLTILHHAETLARIPNKRLVHYKMPVLREGKRVWVEIEDIDTGRGIVEGRSAEEYFITIAQGYLASGRGRSGKVGAAPSYLFAAADLVEFAVEWLERNFGE
jgi:aminoglycoside N3'-acetyltransferase